MSTDMENPGIHQRFDPLRARPRVGVLVELKPRPFGEASAHALGDSQLQESLRKVGGGFDAARLEAIDELGSERWEELRLRAREIKQNAIENLDYWLEMVYDRVTANGGPRSLCNRR